jgi:hypothetical protein
MTRWAGRFAARPVRRVAFVPEIARAVSPPIRAETLRTTLTGLRQSKPGTKFAVLAPRLFDLPDPLHRRCQQLLLLREERRKARRVAIVDQGTDLRHPFEKLRIGRHAVERRSAPRKHLRRGGRSEEAVRFGASTSNPDSRNAARQATRGDAARS